MCNTITVSASITWYVLDVHVSCIKVTMSPANLQKFSLSLSLNQTFNKDSYILGIFTAKSICFYYIHVQ